MIGETMILTYITVTWLVTWCMTLDERPSEAMPLQNCSVWVKETRIEKIHNILFQTKSRVPLAAGRVC